MGYYDDGATMGGFLSNNTKRNIGDFLTVFICGVLIVSALLTAAVVGKRMLFSGPTCIKHHQQVEQVDSYGKKEAVTVCDQYKNEPVTEVAK